MTEKSQSVGSNVTLFDPQFWWCCHINC